MNGQGRIKGKYFFFGLFALLALSVLYVLSPYLGFIALALVVVVMLKPLFDRFMAQGWVRGRRRIATATTLITFFLLIIIPIFTIGYMMVNQAREVKKTIESSEAEITVEKMAATAEDFLRRLPGLDDIEIDPDQFAKWLLDLAQSTIGWLADQAGDLVKSLPNLFIGGIIFLVIVATLLPALDDFTEKMRQLSPLEVNITQIYQVKSREMIMSVIKGVFLLVILQGLIMGFFYRLANVPFTVFWTILSMAFGILPVVGISFVAWFLAIIFLLTGNPTSAVIVLFGFYVVVNPLDLILRPRLVSKKAYLNFTLMLLALFGGLAVGGLLGMIYGPVAMILFVTTIDIYAAYFSDDSGDPDVESLQDAGPESLVEPAVEEHAKPAALPE